MICTFQSTLGSDKNKSQRQICGEKALRGLFEKQQATIVMHKPTE